MKRIKITGVAEDGFGVVGPCQVHITDLDTGEVIHNIQKLSFSASIDDPAITVTLELLPTEIELENFIAEVIPATEMQHPPRAIAEKWDGDSKNGIDPTSIFVPVYELGSMDPVRWVNIKRKTREVKDVDRPVQE